MSEGFDMMTKPKRLWVRHPSQQGDWTDNKSLATKYHTECVLATDYDALAAQLPEQIEWVQRLADDLIAAEAKLAEVEAERDRWATAEPSKQREKFMMVAARLSVGKASQQEATGAIMALCHMNEGLAVASVESKARAKAAEADLTAARAALVTAREALERIADITQHNMPMSARDEQCVNREARAALAALTTDKEKADE